MAGGLTDPGRLLAAAPTVGVKRFLVRSVGLGPDGNPLLAAVVEAVVAAAVLFAAAGLEAPFVLVCELVLVVAAVVGNIIYSLALIAPTIAGVKNYI